MFIKRVLVTNFKSNELRILNELIKMNSSDSHIEVGNIRQTSKMHITNTILSKIELLPPKLKFHAPITMKGKYYCRVLGYILDKDNFVAISLGHQAMLPTGELVLTGEQQCTNFHVVATSEENLRTICRELHLEKFATYLIRLQGSWHVDFARQIKVNLGEVA